MSWLSSKSRPKIKTSIDSQIEVPDNVWKKCKECEAILYHKEIKDNMYICPKCNYHMTMPTEARLKSMFDEGKYEKIVLPKVEEDPIKFEDLKKYKDRLATYKKQTGQDEVITAAYGNINRVPVVVAVFNFEFMGGSMGRAVGEAIIHCVDYSIKQHCPFIVLPASGGARMQEGMLSLMQMARTTMAVNKMNEAGLPYIVLLTNPTFGGVPASFAMLGDIHIAETGAKIGFAGQRVVDQTIKQKFPDGFQTAEYLKDHGMVDVVVDRKELKETLGKILKVLFTARNMK